MSARWYAVMAEPNMDVRVARDLGEQGYEAFTPRMFDRETIKGRAGVSTWLWLSPYVFVAVDEDRRQNLHDVRETLGVSAVVSLTPDIGGHAQASEVPSVIIRHYRHLENADYEAAVRRVRIREPLFYPRDRVTVVADCEFSGWRGTVKEVRHHLVVINLDGGGWPLVLPEDDLARTDVVRTQHAYQAA